MQNIHKIPLSMLAEKLAIWLFSLYGSMPFEEFLPSSQLRYSSLGTARVLFFESLLLHPHRIELHVL